MKKVNLGCEYEMVGRPAFTTSQTTSTLSTGLTFVPILECLDLVQIVDPAKRLLALGGDLEMPKSIFGLFQQW